MRARRGRKSCATTNDSRGLNPEGRVLLTEGNPSSSYDESWNVVPPFGPFPRALSETYPLTAEIPDRMDVAGYESAASGVTRLVEENPETEFTLAHRGWPKSALSLVPETVRTVDLDTV